MDRMTLRRIGWIGASLGLTSLLVGCTDAQSDVQSAFGGEDTGSTGYLEAENGLNVINGLSAANGLNAANGLSAANGLNTANGLGSANGLNTVNGFNGANGFNAANGFTNQNGLNVVNGLNVANGLNTVNGLSAANGLMTTSDGRQTVSYLVKCALAAGDTLVKQDDSGNNYTFQGGIGLAPEYKTGGCTQGCAEALSACLMAHVNTTGVHIPLWLTSPMTPIGWGQSSFYPTQEGTFFGQIMLTNTAYNLDAYYCNGPSVASDVVPGRLGSTTNSTSAPYANAYPTDGGLCNKSGHCVMQSTGDGAISCMGNSINWTRPITVWRGQIFQAEDAALTTGTTIQTGTENSNGKRVGNIGPTATVTFKNVYAGGAGQNQLVLYYADGDCGSAQRYFNVKVNNGGQQSRAVSIVDQGNWHKVGQALITLDGFTAGSTNTVTFSGDGTHAAPDLDWIEVIGAPASTAPALTGTCDESKWVETASINTADQGLGNDNNLTTRWTTGRAMAVGDSYKIDFGGTVKLTRLVLNNSQTSGTDYPGQMQLFASQDGTTFESTPFATVNGAASITTINFTEKVMKTVKIKISSARATAWWSIGEVQSVCSTN